MAKSSNLCVRIEPEVELKLAPVKIKSVDTLAEAEFNAEIEKGYKDFLADKGSPVKEVFSDIRKGRRE